MSTVFLAALIKAFILGALALNKSESLPADSESSPECPRWGGYLTRALPKPSEQVGPVE